MTARRLLEKYAPGHWLTTLLHDPDPRKVAIAQELVDDRYLETASAGEVLFHQGDDSDGALLILEGSGQLVELPHITAGPGDQVGEVGLLVLPKRTRKFGFRATAPLTYLDHPEEMFQGVAGAMLRPVLVPPLRNALLGYQLPPPQSTFSAPVSDHPLLQLSTEEILDHWALEDLKLSSIVRCPTFGALTPAQQKHLVETAEVMVYEPGEVIMREGEEANLVYLRMLGAMQLGEGPLLSSPNRLVGERALLTAHRSLRSGTVKASTRCLALCWPDADFEQDPVMADAMQFGLYVGELGYQMESTGLTTLMNVVQG